VSAKDLIERGVDYGARPEGRLIAYLAKNK